MSYIITYYLPSGLFVVVSWISFLIPPDIVPGMQLSLTWKVKWYRFIMLHFCMNERILVCFAGRMALLITLFLVLINIFNNITTNSPKAEGLTAIEIWMLACILFVFGKMPTINEIMFFSISPKVTKSERVREGVSSYSTLRAIPLLDGS